MRALFGFLCLFATLDLFAQPITLDAGSYPVSLLGTDSLKITTASCVFPSLPSGEDVRWDLSRVIDSTAVLLLYRVPDTSYQFADSALSSLAGFIYQGNFQTSVTASGIEEYGVKIQRSPYSIDAFTSGFNDSLVILHQNMIYSSPRNKLGFSATFGSSWQSSYHSNLDILFTYMVNGDTMVPGVIKKYTTENDSVIGWGKMSVKDANGIPSPYLNVLQIQTKIVNTDSFFLNGFPSNTLVAIFSITQGRSDTIYEQNYYRPQEVTPLAQVEFRDSGYTQPYKATTHVQRLEDVGVPHLVNTSDIKVYPNPVCDHTLFVALPSGGGQWCYELADVTGRKVMKGSLVAANGPASISLPAQLNTGIYYLAVYNEQRQVAILSINFEK
jgi:hypothetical protein